MNLARLASLLNAGKVMRASKKGVDHRRYVQASPFLNEAISSPDQVQAMMRRRLARTRPPW
jgi:hypothetical protein